MAYARAPANGINIIKIYYERMGRLFNKAKEQYNNIYKNINEKLETKNEDLPILSWLILI